MRHTAISSSSIIFKSPIRGHPGASAQISGTGGLPNIHRRSWFESRRERIVLHYMASIHLSSMAVIFWFNRFGDRQTFKVNFIERALSCKKRKRPFALQSVNQTRLLSPPPTSVRNDLWSLTHFNNILAAYIGRRPPLVLKFSSQSSMPSSRKQPARLTIGSSRKQDLGNFNCFSPVVFHTQFAHGYQDNTVRN